MRSARCKKYFSEWSYILSYLSKTSPTALRIFPSEGIINQPFFAATLSFTKTVNSPRPPSINLASKPNLSFINSATRTALGRYDAQTLQYLIVMFCIFLFPCLLQFI
jgi:hypothetical protein